MRYEDVRVGMDVIFVPNDSNGNRSIPNYSITADDTTSTSGLTTLSNNPEARVVKILDKYVQVRYTDSNENRVCLGFLPEMFNPSFTSWKDRYKQ